ncbi:MAG TPA: hypothetical protein DD381_05035 [Lentisphaeria bacterium]|nr:MAG: hypothetical protein A2X47_06380 [Lentisphaerae bacterium GWF2_38_69]HBM15695.1 hypothetical protein [Lentisphaeria bacterium]
MRSFHNILSFKSPYLYILIGIIFLILSGIFHPFDMEYKNALQQIANSHEKWTILNIIKVIGKGEFLVYVALILGVVRYKALACRLLLAFLIASVIIWSLKISVHRERPNHRNYLSFPSGDSGTSACMVASVSSQIPIVAIPGAVVVGAVAFLRNYDNYHYLSDVLAGIGFGVISAGLSMFVKLRRFKIFWKIKPFAFKGLYGVLFLVYLLPPLFNWAFIFWLICGVLLIASSSLKKKKKYDNAC